MAEVEVVEVRGFKLELRDTVYKPAEDSFLMLDVILSLGSLRGLSCLDLGTGSGILALALARLGCVTVASDVSLEAVNLAKRNFSLNGLSGEVVQADLTGAFRDRSFDLLVSNPPYLPVDEAGEPAKAWSGGEKGRAVIDRLLSDLRRVLKPGGKAMILHADFNEPSLSVELGRRNGFEVRVAGRRKLAFHELFVLEFELKRCE